MAVITAISGSSPDDVGACLFVTATETFAEHMAEARMHDIANQAQELLESRTTHHLGTVQPGINCYEVLYLYHPAHKYPQWLTTMCAHREQGTSCTLLTSITCGEFEYAVLGESEKHKLPDIDNFIRHDASTCFISTSRNGELEVFLLRTRSDTLKLCLIGDHDACQHIAEQTKALPIELNWLQNTQPESSQLLENVPANSAVVIMTKDHALDFHLCSAALQTPKLLFIGCIGSANKAAAFKKKLQDLGYTDQQCQKLTMPVGLAGISGKRPSVIAASVVAQLMTLRTW